MMTIDWMRKVHQLEYAHRYESLFWSRVGIWVGVLSTLIAAVIATSYQFPPISPEEHEELWRWLRRDYFVPISSFVVAALTAISTLLRPLDKAETHRRHGAEYESLRHDLELTITRNPPEKEYPTFTVPWKEKWDKLGAPNVMKRYFERGKRRVNELGKYPEELPFLESINPEE